MGADLYIEKLQQPLRQKYEPLFEAAVKKRDALPPNSRKAHAAQKVVTKYYDLMYSQGYFRDSYNVSNVLNRLGLSWWVDVKPLCTPDRELCDEQLRKFRDMVASATLTLPSREEIEQQGGTVGDTGANNLSAWHTYFAGEQRALLAFLNQAIELDSPIRCSL
jgi:hypothetical protein